MALFFLASLAFELSFSFYNGFLPEIADEESMNRVSGYGYAAGYFGGGVALAVAIAVLSIGSWLWSDDRIGPARGPGDHGPVVGASSRCPLRSFFATATRRAARLSALSQPPGMRLARSLHTLSRIRSYSVLALFLLGFLFYNEGIQTVMSQASVFAREVLEDGRPANWAWSCS